MANVNVYQMVTDRIISELEKGIIPWNKPWSGSSEGAYNRVSHRPYSLLNQMMLQHSGEYATYKQWQSLGGQVRKGEKSEFVVFWKVIDYIEKDKNGEEKKSSVPILRFYNVFHISQVDGVESESKTYKEVHPITECDELISSYVNRSGVHYSEEIGDNAYYSPMSDSVVVPCKEQYEDIQEFYSTVFHELIHSTGHESRLDRGLGVSGYGQEDYSKEELVAEIGAATLLNQLGIETSKTFKNSVAYIQSWIKALENDNKFIVSAASKAAKAVQYINGEDVA